MPVSSMNNRYIVNELIYLTLILYENIIHDTDNH